MNNTVMALEHPSDEASARAATQAWIHAFNRGDAATITALYDPQAVLWGTTAPQIITTPQGVHAYFAAVFSLRPAPRMELGDVWPRLFGAVAVCTGSYTLTLAAPLPARQVPARFSFTYRLGATGWRIVDHHSSAVPLPLQG